ncbi:hypothetical protein F441_00538 [Phytophthora nicotianae CJ01A1]|uniref:Tc1-like transposase DDE domain-containing protein n=2 Tax=Phytophthora nicotianae TaxID=4792 RepID=W2JUY5_PHYNI|nr:hypothetical protein L915_00515 [Phytophthora nicotianae]ETL50200.1 hypothetical protein L916_00520 [Phytophthora nicotianae]ETP26873.1 hypothetical protein F441_00538 [Phytophthora nicotianae CJ01A1]
MAACVVRGFMAWETTSGTSTRQRFHQAFIRQAVKHLNPWPLPRSIVVMGNDLIHMYKEIEEMAHRCGAILLYLPPYYRGHVRPIEELNTTAHQFGISSVPRICTESGNETMPAERRTRLQSVPPLWIRLTRRQCCCLHDRIVTRGG